MKDVKYVYRTAIRTFSDKITLQKNIRGSNCKFSDEVFGQKTICHALLKWMEMEN